MSDEAVVARLRPHVRALFWPTVLLLLVVAALGFLSNAFREEWQNTAMLIVAGVLALAGWLVPLLRWASRSYTVTTRRVVVGSGVLSRTRVDVPYGRVAYITLRRGALQTLLGSGNLEIDTGSERPVVLVDVSSARLVQKALLDLVEHASAGAGP